MLHVMCHVGETSVKLYSYYIILLSRVDEHFVIIWFSTMGSAASRLCESLTPTVSLSDTCRRMRCLVACCGDEVHIELKDDIDNHEEKNTKEEDDPQSDEPTIRETVL